MRIRDSLFAGLLGVAACGGDEASPMPGMTAEEHARMQAGTQGATDTSGALLRQTVHLTPEQERALGVVYTTVRRDTLTRTIRTVGRILAAEPRVADVTPKVEGFVERLYVDATGQAVRRGEPLLALYSPMLVAAQEELLTAARMAARVDSAAGEAWANAQTLLAAARRRLAYWDVPDEQIARIEQSGTVSKTLTLVAPVGGVVLEKDVLEGQQIMPGMRLYRIADLSEIWIEGDVFEQDLRFVGVGTQAHVELAAYPGEHLMGRVTFVYPTVEVTTRANRVRLTVGNPRLRLKPGMYATVFFDAVVPDVIAVPMASVVVTGERNLVFVRGEQGMLTPRDVVLGTRAAERVQILAGLAEGERIVASANFLVDAESRLASTGTAMPGMQHGAVDQPAPPPSPRQERDSAEHQHD